MPTPDKDRSKESLLQELEELRLRERQWRALVDHCPIPLFLKNTHGNYLLANKEYQKWHVAKETDFLGRSTEFVLPPGRAETARQRDNDVLKSRVLIEYKLNWTFPDGETRATIGTKFPVYDNTGHAIGVGGALVDITRLRATEAALDEARDNLARANQELETRVELRTRELAAEVDNHTNTSDALRTNETLLRLIIDSLPVLIAYVDFDLRFRMINKTGAEWYAQPTSEVLGKRPSDIFGAIGSAWEEQMKAAFLGGQDRLERTVTYPDGVTRDIQVVFAPHNSNQKTVGLCILIEDITEQKNQNRSCAGEKTSFAPSLIMRPLW